MSSASQTDNTHTGLSAHLVKFQQKILVLAPQAATTLYYQLQFLSNP